MCEPISATTAIMVGLAAVSTAVGVAGSIQQGQAQKKMAERNAQAIEQNTKFNAARQQDRAQRMAAQGRVNIAKSGVQTSGSPLDVLADSAMQSELDHLSIIRSGDSQAALSRYEGASAAQRGYFGAATTALYGASRAMGAFGGGVGGSSNAGVTGTSYANYAGSGFGADL